MIEIERFIGFYAKLSHTKSELKSPGATFAYVNTLYERTLRLIRFIVERFYR